MEWDRVYIDYPVLGKEEVNLWSDRDLKTAFRELTLTVDVTLVKSYVPSVLWHQHSGVSGRSFPHRVQRG